MLPEWVPDDQFSFLQWRMWWSFQWPIIRPISWGELTENLLFTPQTSELHHLELLGPLSCENSQNCKDVLVGTTFTKSMIQLQHPHSFRSKIATIDVGGGTSITKANTKINFWVHYLKLVAQSSATGVIVAAIPPCSAISFRNPKVPRYPPPARRAPCLLRMREKCDRGVRRKVRLLDLGGCSAILARHLWFCRNLMRHSMRDTV